MAANPLVDMLVLLAVLTAAGAGAEQDGWTEHSGLNCYPGHGAEDVEPKQGRACCTVSLNDCQQKCDELSGCTGITMRAGSGNQKCYRRGKVDVNKCRKDKNYVTYIKSAGPPAPTPPAPSIVKFKANTQACLDLGGGNTTNGNYIEVWSCNGLVNQNWIFSSPNAAGYSKIMYGGNVSKCIAISGDANGDKLTIWDCEPDGQNFGQLWMYDDKNARFITRIGQKCINLYGANTNDGAKVAVWDCNGFLNQQWVTSGQKPPSPASPPTPPSPSQGATLVTYYAPTQSFPSGPFSVIVSQKSSTPQTSFVYHSVAPSDGPNPQLGKSVSWTTFSFEGSVRVSVTLPKNASWSKCVIRPVKLGVSVSRDGAAAVFTLTKPAKVVVEFDGDTTDSLLVFADALEKSNGMESRTLYFEPGIHDIGQQHGISAGNIVYIAGGAWVRGTFFNKDDATGVVIHGRGVLSGEKISHPPQCSDTKAMITLCGDDVTISGITVINPPTYLINVNPYWLKCTGRRAIIENVKLWGWHYTSDGIMVGRDSHVHDSFVRANDDSLKLYMSNTLWEWNTIWQADNGQSFMISWNTPSDEKNITVRDSVVVQCEHAKDFGDNARPSIFGAVHGANGHLSGYVFERIVVEPRVVHPFGIAVQPNAWGGGNAGTISGLTFTDISFTHNASDDSIIHGNAKEKNPSVSQISFMNLRYQDKPVTSASQGRFTIDGSTTSDIDFEPAMSDTFLSIV